MNTSVVHVFGVMDRGGAELRTLSLIDLVPGVDHTFVTLSGRRGVLAEDIERLGGKVIPCRLSPVFPARFIRLLHRLEPDTVQSNVATFSGAILALAWLAGVRRRVAHFRSDGDEHGDGLLRRVQRGVMRQLIALFATDVLGNAPQALAFAWPPSQMNDPRARMVPDGVASGPQPDDVVTSPSPLIICHIARSLHTKRRARAVEILNAAVLADLDAQLQVVGEITAQERARLQRLAESLGTLDRITFHGSVSDVSATLEEASMLLVTSSREGLPGVVMEALAHGCPVASTDLPGVLHIKKFCEGIVAVNVDADDEVWVQAIKESVSTGHPTRFDIWKSFQESPFTLANAANEMRTLWTAPTR